MTDTTATPNPLKPSQRRRVAALEASRDVQTSRRSASVLASPSTTPPDAIDLVTVAQFILTGEDPWPTRGAVSDATADRLWSVSDDRVWIEVRPGGVIYRLHGEGNYTELRREVDAS